VRAKRVEAVSDSLHVCSHPALANKTPLSEKIDQRRSKTDNAPIPTGFVKPPQQACAFTRCMCRRDMAMLTGGVTRDQDRNNTCSEAFVSPKVVLHKTNWKRSGNWKLEKG
jgi:hypothetical protein